jgi:hypothetical protein
VRQSGSVVDVTGVWSVTGGALTLTGDISAGASPRPRCACSWPSMRRTM